MPDTDEAAEAVAELREVRKVAAKAKKLVSGEATFESLLKKPRRVLNFTVNTSTDAGSPVELKMRYQALASQVYDDLIAAHPPTDKDKKAGNPYNVDTFAPALISAVSVIPRLSVEQATEIYTADSWSGGEISSLYINALRVCNAGIDVSFSEPG